MLVHPNQGQQGSSSRSMSISMDDSINLQIQPIVQKMTVVNSHQLLVRKPSDHAQELLKSPPTTMVTPQIASDRPLQSDIKDLLLINEEPSIKEQSMQISEQQPKKTHVEQPIDEKQEYTFSDVRWSRLVSSKTTSTNPSFQLNLIQDKAAQLDEPHISKCLLSCLQPKKQNLYYLINKTVYCIYLCFFITQILLDEQLIPVFQLILASLQILDALNYIIFIQYKNGVQINTFEDLIQNYIKYYSMIDILTLIPIVFALTGQEFRIIQLLHIIRLQKIYFFVKELELMFGKYILILYYLIEFHMISFISLTIIVIIEDVEINYFNEYLVVLYKSEESNILTYIIKILVICYYIFCIKRFFDTDIEEISKMNLHNDLKKQVRNYLQNLHNPTINLNFMDHLPNQLVEEIKYQRYSKLLQQIPIFKSSFSDKTLKEVCNLIEEYSYNPNQLILMQQTSNQQLFLILNGKVQIAQRKEGSYKDDFKLKQLNEGNIFNNQAFFKNQYSNICATSIGFSQIAQLDLEKFQECIKNHHQERQKYKMMLDQIVMCEFYSLCMMRCYACGKFHDIDECDHVHYVPKRSVLVSYIQSSDIQIRRSWKRIQRQRKKRSRSYMLNIEENALDFKQQNWESDPSDENQHRDEIISIQQQHYLREVTNPYTDRQNSLSQQTPHIVSQQSMRESLHSQQQQQQQQQLLMDIPNISPVQYVQQPPSGMSHSSYGQLLKDVSVNRKNFNGSSDKNSSGNVFSMPYSSNGSKNTPNKVQEKEELISIQLKKAKLQDSVYYHQKRIQNQVDTNSQHTPSKYQKYHTTTTPQQQQQQRTLRSDRKSNSCISESERGEYNIQQQQQDKQPSKYGITSSKFTGETAKQFMRNPLEMPHLEFYQSFEKSNQFSDYFPQFNIDQQLESYKQFQQSRSSYKQ